MTKITSFLIIFFIQATCAKAQLNLSPVNTGDCVAARITSNRTACMDVDVTVAKGKLTKKFNGVILSYGL